MAGAVAAAPSGGGSGDGGGGAGMIPTRAAARNPAPDKSGLSAVFFCHQ